MGPPAANLCQKLLNLKLAFARDSVSQPGEEKRRKGAKGTLCVNAPETVLFSAGIISTMLYPYGRTGLTIIRVL